MSSNREELERIARLMYLQLVSGGWIPPNTTFELNPVRRRQNLALSNDGEDTQAVLPKSPPHDERSSSAVTSPADQRRNLWAKLPSQLNCSISFHYSMFFNICQYPPGGSLLQSIEDSAFGGASHINNDIQSPGGSSSAVPNPGDLPKEESIWDMAIRVLQPPNGDPLPERQIRSILGKARKKWPDEELRSFLEQIDGKDYVDPFAYFLACVRRERGKFDPGRLAV